MLILRLERKRLIQETLSWVHRQPVFLSEQLRRVDHRHAQARAGKRLRMNVSLPVMLVLRISLLVLQWLLLLR
jgi:hypothetical protein